MKLKDIKVEDTKQFRMKAARGEEMLIEYKNTILKCQEHIKELQKHIRKTKRAAKKLEEMDIMDIVLPMIVR
jgi:hypothetical protein